MKEIKLSELKFLRLKGFKMKEIAKFYAISEPTLAKIIKKYNIPKKPGAGGKIKVIEDLKENENKDYSNLIKEIKQKKKITKQIFIKQLNIIIYDITLSNFRQHRKKRKYSWTFRT